MIYKSKMRGGEGSWAPVGNIFDIIKYSRIIYTWMENFMLINFYVRTKTLK